MEYAFTPVLSPLIYLTLINPHNYQFIYKYTRTPVTESEKRKTELVPKQVWDKQKIEGRYIKCRRSNY